MVRISDRSGFYKYKHRYLLLGVERNTSLLYNADVKSYGNMVAECMQVNVMAQ